MRPKVTKKPSESFVSVRLVPENPGEGPGVLSLLGMPGVLFTGMERLGDSKPCSIEPHHCSPSDFGSAQVLHSHV